MLGTFVSDKTHDAAFIERLNFIHSNYCVDPELPPATPNSIESLLLDPSLPTLLRELISRYIDDLNCASPLRTATKIVVRIERKGHDGKTVTLVQGIPKVALESICSEMKSALGCGGRVEDDTLVLQGEFVDRPTIGSRKTASANSSAAKQT